MLKQFLSICKVTLIIYISFFLTFNFPQALSAEQVEAGKKEIKMAVLDFKGISISENDAMVITNIFRDQLFNTGRFQLLDRALVDDLLNKFHYQEAGICDVECAINIGENLDCDKVITGDVSRLGDLYIINVRMVDIESQSLELSELFRKKCQLEDLVDEMAVLVDGFLAKYDKIAASQTVAGEMLPESPVQTAETVATETTTKEPEPVEVVKNGKVIVKTIPDGAVVTANGKFFGVSPFEPKELTPGKYNFIAKKKGYTDAGMEIEILAEKTTELLLSLKPIQVVASPEAEKPEEEEKGGGTIWLILGGAAVVGILAILLSGGQEEQPKPTTGTLAFSNNLNYSVYVEIDGSSRGSVNAYSTANYTLSPGSHTVRVTAGSSSTGLTSNTIQNRKQSAEELENNNLSRINKNRIARNRNRSSNNADIQKLSTYSKTYTIYITAGETTTLNHGSSWDNGDIYVQSSPSGAQVWLDNSNTGKTTPATLNYISSGSHNVTCKLSDYEDTYKTINVASGITTNVIITLTLIKDGRIYVTSDPSNAQIWLDGSNSNKTTPSTIYNVSPGWHTVTCKMTGYYDKSKSVCVDKNQTSIVNINLDERSSEYGRIYVTSEPSGAEIWIDDYFKQGEALTPSLIRGVLPGSRKVTCCKDGYKCTSKYVDVVAGQTTNCHINLDSATD